MRYVLEKSKHPLGGYRIDPPYPSDKGKSFFIHLGMVDRWVEVSGKTTLAFKILEHDEHQDKFANDLAEFVNRWVEENPTPE